MPEEKDHTNLLDVIRDLKRRDPFLPFEIVLTSGDRYQIEVGENLVEMRTEFFYAFPKGDKFAFLRINQIVAVEPSGSASKLRRPSWRKASWNVIAKNYTD